MIKSFYSENPISSWSHIDIYTYNENAWICNIVRTVSWLIGLPDRGEGSYINTVYVI